MAIKRQDCKAELKAKNLRSNIVDTIMLEHVIN